MYRNKNIFYSLSVVDFDEAMRRLRHFIRKAQYADTQEKRKHAARVAGIVVGILEKHNTRSQIHFKEDAF